MASNYDVAAHHALLRKIERFFDYTFSNRSLFWDAMAIDRSGDSLKGLEASKRLQVVGKAAVVYIQSTIWHRSPASLGKYA